MCYSSPVSGWRCGTITGINQPGSGTTVRAIGLVAGGSGNRTSGGTSWVQPISEPLAVYGLALVTG